MMKRSFLISFALVVLLSTASFARTFTHMSMNVPDGWTAEETRDGMSVILDGPSSSYVIIYALTEKGNDTLKDVAEEYCDYYSGSGLKRDSIGGFYSFSTEHWGTPAVAMVHDSSTRSAVPSGYCLLQVVSDATSYDTWEYINGSLSIHMSGGGGGGGGCNAGFGILSLLVIGFAFRKK